jgi:hypothetical protein
MNRFNSRWPRVLIVAAAAAMLFLPLGNVRAQVASPCDDDFSKYCGDVTPGGGRLVACYERNKDKMSGDCRSWAEGAKAYAKVVTDACSKEINQACTIATGDPLAMLNCLQGQYINLSQKCISKLNEFKYLYPQVNAPPPGQ